jgi:glyoxylase-like metal-dependent hydrolase (beta-lactamase superfamily II)
MLLQVGTVFASVLKQSDIRYVAASHLHLDHAGCLEMFINASIIVQEDESKKFRKSINGRALYKKGARTKCQSHASYLHRLAMSAGERWNI